MSEPEGKPVPTAAARTPRTSWIDWLEQRINLSELFSFLTHFGLVYTPIDTQRPLREVLRQIASTPIVSYARWPHILGLLTALLFMLQAVSGVLLAFYYQPTTAEAYVSTREIVRDVPLGWLVHQVHAWGSYLLVGVVLLRLIRLFWDGLYRAPREVLWFSGVGLGWLALQLDFTGLLLPWDVQSYWAAVRGLEVVWSVPVVGAGLSFVVGGRVMSEDVLSRFYVLHSIVLPFFYMVLVYVTFGTMRRVGLSAAAGAEHAPLTTFKRYSIDLVIVTLLLFAGLVTLATVLPFGFSGAADPYVTPRGTRPPWYMLAPYALFQGVPVPDWIPGLVVLLLGIAVLLLPILVRRMGGQLDDKRVRFFGIGLLGVWAALSVLGLFVDRP